MCPHHRGGAGVRAGKRAAGGSLPRRPSSELLHPADHAAADRWAARGETHAKGTRRGKNPVR